LVHFFIFMPYCLFLRMHLCLLARWHFWVLFCELSIYLSQCEFHFLLWLWPNAKSLVFSCFSSYSYLWVILYLHSFELRCYVFDPHIVQGTLILCCFILHVIVILLRSVFWIAFVGWLWAAFVHVLIVHFCIVVVWTPVIVLSYTPNVSPFCVLVPVSLVFTSSFMCIMRFSFVYSSVIVA